MPTDDRSLLDVLNFELNVLEKGGYGSSPRQPWRTHLVFEGSPTCMNYDSKEQPAPCSKCVLMQLVPTEMHGERIPCRHIPLTTGGETLDSIYRYGTQQEIEKVVGAWLRTTIQHLETEERLEAPDVTGLVCRVAL